MEEPHELPSTEEPDSAAGRTHRDTVVVLLVLILLVGAWLRFSMLSNQSLWNDELWTWDTASKGTLREMLTTGRLASGEQTHPPLYFILQHFVVRTIGDSETVMRLPSAIAGLLTILAVYLLGRRLEFCELDKIAMRKKLTKPVLIGGSENLGIPQLIKKLLGSPFRRL